MPLRSAAMPYSVCSYCLSVTMHQGDQLVEVGKAADLVLLDLGKLHCEPESSVDDFPKMRPIGVTASDPPSGSHYT